MTIKKIKKLLIIVLLFPFALQASEFQKLWVWNVLDYNVVELYSQTPLPQTPSYTACFTDANDKQVIDLMYIDDDEVITYNPMTNIFEQVERSIFPDLWFKSLYPNPAIQSNKITAEIWCWLNDVSQVELALYDFMGKQVLDFSNQFEYNSSAFTIYTSFEIPKTLSKGIYFLVVKNGNEIRSQGIIIDQ